MKTNCPVYSKYCHQHGFVHGAEAEELRSGLEQIIKDHPHRVATTLVQELLDRVDARDSLAYLEAANPSDLEEPDAQQSSA